MLRTERCSKGEIWRKTNMTKKQGVIPHVWTDHEKQMMLQMLPEHYQIKNLKVSPSDTQYIFTYCYAVKTFG